MSAAYFAEMSKNHRKKGVDSKNLRSLNLGSEVLPTLT